MAAFSRGDRVIHSWDTQAVSEILVFALSTKWSTNLEEPRGRPGVSHANFPFPGMDEGSAQLLNYIALRGSWHDKAALVKALSRCTTMGRLGEWSPEVDGYQKVWQIFCRARESLKEWAALPGVLVHHREDYFDRQSQEECDVLYVDPPKIIGHTDIYSGKTFAHLNQLLEQKLPAVNQPEWTADNYLPRVLQVLKERTWDRAFVIHTSGVVPTIEEFAAEIAAGTTNSVVSVTEYEHGNRMDYVISVK